MGIWYRKLKGYKYRLSDPYHHSTEIRGPEVLTPYITLSEAGLLSIRMGYCWDGPSGPTIDTKDFMRGSLVHDALYQLIREKRIPATSRLYADSLLHSMIREDGMGWIRAAIVYHSVRLFGAFAAVPGSQKRVTLSAP